MIASKQIAENYVETGRKKAELPVSHMLILGFFAAIQAWNMPVDK